MMKLVNIIRFFSLTVLFTFVLNSTLAAEEGGVVVWKLEKKSGVQEDDIDSISGFLTSEVENVSKGRTFSEADIQTILKGEEARQKCGKMGETSCLTEIGNALGVPEAISGDLGKLGSIWILNLRRINVLSAQVVGRASRQIDGPIESLVRAIPGAVREIYGIEEPVKTAQIPPKIVKKEKPVTPTVEKSAPKSSLKTWGWVSLGTGIGVAGILGGLGTGMAFKAADDYNNGDRGAKDTNKAWWGTAIAGYSIGGALIVTGVVLLLMDDEPKEASNTPYIGFSTGENGNEFSVSLTGRW